MKKIILSLIITFTILILSNNESIAQCPSGFTLKTVTLTIGPCDYDIQLCYKCGITNPGEVTIVDIKLKDNSCTPLPLEQVFDGIYASISNYQFIYTELCPSYNAPDCDDQSDVYIINHWNCWEAELVEYFGDTTYVYRPCNYDSYCKEYAKFCWDPISETYIKTYHDIVQIGEPNCDDTEIWEVTLPTQLNQVSDCFIYRNTPCGN